MNPYGKKKGQKKRTNERHSQHKGGKHPGNEALGKGEKKKKTRECNSKKTPAENNKRGVKIAAGNKKKTESGPRKPPSKKKKNKKGPRERILGSYSGNK